MANKIVFYLDKYKVALVILLIILLAYNVRIVDYRWSYLRNIDSYAFLRTMDMIIENNGVIPDHDYLILAPYGHSMGKNIFLYQYLGAYSYLFISFFSPGIELWEFMIYFPAFLAALMTIPMYFIGKVLYDRKAGIIAAFFIVFNLSIMSRTLGGDPDSDGIVLLLPLIVMALFLFTNKLVEETGINKKSILYSIITGIVTGMWGYSWLGWWYVVWMITGFVFLKLVINYIEKRKIREWFLVSKNMIYMFLIVAVAYSFVTVPILGTDHLISTATGPFVVGDLKSEETEFPNVYVSVAEMQEAGGPMQILQRTSVLGDIAVFVSPFFMMIYSLVYLLFSYIIKRRRLDTVILLGIWFLGPFIATMAAVRFSILFAAPLAIGSAIILSKLLRMASGEDEKIEE